RAQHRPLPPEVHRPGRPRHGAELGGHARGAARRGQRGAGVSPRGARLRRDPCPLRRAHRHDRRARRQPRAAGLGREPRRHPPHRDADRPHLRLLHDPRARASRPSIGAAHRERLGVGRPAGRLRQARRQGHVRRQRRRCDDRHDPGEGRVHQPGRAPVAGPVRERGSRPAQARERDGRPCAGGADRARQPLRLRGGRGQQGRLEARDARLRRGGVRGGGRHRAGRARGRRGRAEPAARERRVRGRARAGQGRRAEGRRRRQGEAVVNFSEAFIRRPVMTILLSASAVVAGILAYGGIPIAALPQFDTPIVQVTALLPGASPETMASSVATPLEKQFSTISSLDVISSTSTQGQTQITLEFNQDRNIDDAAVDVQAALFRASRNLPPEMTTPPSYRKVNPGEFSIIFVTLSSPSMSLSELDGYAENLVSPTLSTLPGVAQISVAGQKRFAVRVKARPDALAARNLTLDDIAAAVKTANANTPVGTLDGPRQTLTILANRQLARAADFKPLIVATLANGSVVRLQDVADVEDSVESVKTASWSNGEPSIALFVQRQPGANTVAAIDSIKAALPSVLSQMPKSVNLQIQLDRSISIRAAIHDVKITLGITAGLVVLVIYLFLRRPSATIIPALSLPISLLGTLGLMRALGLSIDNVSLLGFTLAVGLVVDDAIVMLENIVRHIEDGMDPFEAAIVGSKEMWFTIVSISISLVAVFIPIFFMPGVIGGLFHEFAIVVSLAILVSAGVSLTLVPMLASRYIRH